MIVFAKTSHEAWITLERSFSAQTQARSGALRRQLGECQKLNQSATEYYNHVKSLADTLASIGQPITDAEFTSYLLNGLDEEYDSLVEIVNERETPMLPHALYSRLLLTEQRVEARRSHVAVAESSAHAAYKGGRTPPSSGKAPAPPPKPQPAAPPPSTPQWGGRLVRICQLCGRESHLSSKCHRRFQRSFLGIGNDGKDPRNNKRQAAMADRPAPQGPQGQT